jgi:hypothetical protein
MATPPARFRRFALAWLCACLAWASGALAHTADRFPLAGTWTLVAADVIHPDGSRTRDFGADPKGSLLIGQDGRYSLQIFRAERPRFAAGDKAKGTADEYKAAVTGSSTHFGQLAIDPARHLLTFRIEGASFPNWEGQRQSRQFELKGDVLSYRVPPRPDGNVPVSVWRRIDTPPTR